MGSERSHVAIGRTGQNRDQTEWLCPKKERIWTLRGKKRGSQGLSTVQEAGEEIFNFSGILNSALSCLDCKGVKSLSPHICTNPTFYAKV